MKSLYGLKTASADWQAALCAFLVKGMGMKRMKCDNCVFMKHFDGKDGSPKGMMIIFTYVDDVMDALLLVTEKSNGRAYNVATGIPTTVTELVETITDIYGYKPEFKYDLTKPIMVSKRVVKVNKIYEELNWKTKHTLREGLEKTIEWYTENCK